MGRRVKVAVIGSGLAGLTASYLLTRDYKHEDVEFEVHLFEKSSVLGMDAASLSIPYASESKEKREWRVDVPMRSFQGGYYPQLIALYTRIGVAFRQSDFSYSFSRLSIPDSWTTSKKTRSIRTSIIYDGASGRNGISRPACYLPHTKASLDEQLKALLRFYLSTTILVLFFVRLHVLASPLLRRSDVSRMNFVQWCAETTPRSAIAQWMGLDQAWERFAAETLVTLFSAVCTAPAEDVLKHPAEEFLDYIWLTLGTHHYVVTHGVRDAAARLSGGLPPQNIHLSTPVTRIYPTHASSHPSQQMTLETPRGLYEGFHHIVLAAPAHISARILRSHPPHQYIEAQARVLSAVKYVPTVVLTHTDGTLLPDCARDRRDLNLMAADDASLASLGRAYADEPDNVCVHGAYAMASHVLSRPPGYSAQSPAVYQTTNALVPPREGTVHGVAKLERAVLTLAAKEALNELFVPKVDSDRHRWWRNTQTLGEKGGLGRLQGAGRLLSSDASTINGLAGVADDEATAGVWICGSFAQGIPLLEGCVVSARAVVEQGILRSEGVRVDEPW